MALHPRDVRIYKAAVYPKHKPMIFAIQIRPPADLKAYCPFLRPPTLLSRRATQHPMRKRAILPARESFSTSTLSQTDVLGVCPNSAILWYIKTSRAIIQHRTVAVFTAFRCVTSCDIYVTGAQIICISTNKVEVPIEILNPLLG